MLKRRCHASYFDGSINMECVSTLIECVITIQIAVHCHAGYGRTGIAIASILIALKGMTAYQVIKQIREKRYLSLAGIIFIIKVPHIIDLR